MTTKEENNSLLCPAYNAKFFNPYRKYYNITKDYCEKKNLWCMVLGEQPDGGQFVDKTMFSFTQINQSCIGFKGKISFIISKDPVREYKRIAPWSKDYARDLCLRMSAKKMLTKKTNF